MTLLPVYQSAYALPPELTVPVLIASAIALVAFTWKAVLRSLWTLGMDLAKTDLQREVSEVTKPDLAAVEQALERHGQALTKALTNVFLEQTAEVARSCATIERQIGETAKEVAHIAGFLEAQRGYLPPP